MTSEKQLRQEMVRYGGLLHQRGFTAAYDGNISCRLDDDRLLITPSGLCKGMLEPDDMVIADLRGKKLVGRHQVSSESAMHVLIYSQRPEVGAIVHAHPPTATGFAVAGVALDEPLLAEMIATLGTVPLAPYGTPGTAELSDALEPYTAQYDAILMANHGVVCCGVDVQRAYLNMELVEQGARIMLVAHQLGGGRPLSEEQLARLRRIRERCLPDTAVPANR